MSVALVWLRRDLRIHDHPALSAAKASADHVVPVFCLDDRLLHGRHASGPRTQFLLECLTDLSAVLAARGGALVIRRGTPHTQLPALARELAATALHFSADAGPFARARDDHVVHALNTAGIPTHDHPGAFAVDEPEAIRTTAGTPYTVFTPFYRAWAAAPRRELHAAPRKLAIPRELDAGAIPSLGELGLSQEVDEPSRGGERAGRQRMTWFLREMVDGYEHDRNDLGADATSRLSPYLHFGCISPRELEHRLPSGPGADALRRQLAWRDFYGQVIARFPANARHEHQERLRGAVRWSRAHKRFEAWCHGRTGFPVVDAAMRQLRHEGWVHNRARLIAGSFLTKDLGIDWRWGERWFMRLLVDGDEANNNGNWQWIASVGVDPQPVSRRLLNPTRQQQRFDPDGIYVRRYVTELRDVPDTYLAEPWTMPDSVQRQAGCRIGRDYPRPIVDHAAARRDALHRYSRARAS